MRGYRDRTSDAAVGSVNREWKRMVELALKIRKRNCNSDWAYEQEKKFTGIFRRLLTDPVEELENELRG